MKQPTPMMKELLMVNPIIIKAMKEGWALSDCQHGRRAAQQMDTKIQMASYRYGPKSQEVTDATTEAARVSVMLTAARAAYNQIIQIAEAVADVQPTPKKPAVYIPQKKVAKTDVADLTPGTRLHVAELREAAHILEATKTYPSGWPRTKRTGYPYLRELRRHAGIPNITTQERDRAAKEVGWSGPTRNPIWTPGLPKGHGLPAKTRRNNRILAAMRTYNGRHTKRKGWPYLRDLSTHAGFRITRSERKQTWSVIRHEPPEPLRLPLS